MMLLVFTLLVNLPEHFNSCIEGLRPSVVVTFCIASQSLFVQLQAEAGSTLHEYLAILVAVTPSTVVNVPPTYRSWPLAFMVYIIPSVPVPMAAQAVPFQRAK